MERFALRNFLVLSRNLPKTNPIINQEIEVNSISKNSFKSIIWFFNFTF